MPTLSAVSDTLYIPLLGRIYTSTYYPGILFDAAALSVFDRLDDRDRSMSGQTEYTLLASAVRSMNVDHYIRAFLRLHPFGVVVNLGCGLETLCQRNDNGTAIWYELDLPEVMEIRGRYFPQTERDRYLSYSVFDYTWMDLVSEAQQNPVLIIAAGLLLYFPEEQVIDLIRRLSIFPNAEIVFDTLSPAGLRTTRRLIRNLGKQKAAVYFCVDHAEAFARRISTSAEVLEERRFYSLIGDCCGTAFDTRFRMAVSDLFNMVKLIHLRLNMSSP